MAISGTYGGMQRQIIDELGDRSELLASMFASLNSPIKQAIQSAIAKWEREPFYFNEFLNTATPMFTTVAGQELYTTADATVIATAPNIWTLHALIAANRWPLEKRSIEWMEENSVNPAGRGQPTDWAYFAKTIRLYPIPDGAYPIRAARIDILAALSADTDTNVWMTDGYDLVKSEAKLTLGRNFLHDEALVNAMTAAIYGNPMNPRERGYLAALKAETTRRARSKIRPTSF